MKTDIERFWNEKKEKLRHKYSNITDKDLCFREGKEKKMIEMLGSKLGKTEQELLYIIISL
jgi:predicted transposase YbfD/YdcC